MADDLLGSHDGHVSTQGPSQTIPSASAPLGSSNYASSVLPRTQSNSPQLIQPSTKNAPKKSAPHSSQSTTIESSSSMMPAQTTNPTDTPGPSPYGTRSRNRNGNTRPNYAEDREMDMDYDSAGGKKSQAPSGSASSNSLQSSETSQFSTVNTRRSSLTGSGAASGKSTATTAAPKDYIPGMSSFSLNPEANPAPQTQSKKRKAPGGNPTTAASYSNITPNTSYPPPRRTASTVSTVKPRETNMLTFESCQGYLKNEKLKADDGTLLGLNGKRLPAFTKLMLVCSIID